MRFKKTVVTNFTKYDGYTKHIIYELQNKIQNPLSV